MRMKLAAHRLRGLNWRPAWLKLAAFELLVLFAGLIALLLLAFAADLSRLGRLVLLPHA